VYRLINALRQGLADLADAEKAEGMRQYMKSEMPFRGVQKPAREQLLRTAIAAHPLPDPTTLLAIACELWDQAAFREERYLALGLVGHRRYAGWAEPSWVASRYRHWIVTGSWWDFTDEIANRHIGPLLRAHPAELTPLMRAWATDGDRWLRRTSIICQLGSGAGTDVDLLTETIEANIADPDFFLRKGIGWALRHHARVDPEWVRAFVAAHPGLSTLSRREALKHIGA
jgi:3-methyladenine DNA glycosylase AlkD